MSLCGQRYIYCNRHEIALGSRLIMFIVALVFYFTKPDVHCGCTAEYDTYGMKFGPQYNAFKSCGIILIIYGIFNLLFLLSRRILLLLLRNVSVETDMVIFKLCYV